MSGTEAITYDAVDVAEFLSLVDPCWAGYERLVRSLRQASAGVDAARVMAQCFVSEFLVREGRDAYELDSELANWWQDESPADDLRTIAREQAERYRNMAFDFRLSDNHPDRIEATAGQWEALAEDLAAWADRPRHDFLEQLQEEAKRKPWPVRLVYEHKHGAKNARLFLGQRPTPIISSDGRLFSFEGGAWAETTDEALAAEVRRTDPTDVLDVDHVAKIVKGVHQSTVVAARPFEWLEPDGTEPAPEDLALFRNGLQIGRAHV